VNNSGTLRIGAAGLSQSVEATGKRNARDGLEPVAGIE
jgi:hypothetical protein